MRALSLTLISLLAAAIGRSSSFGTEGPPLRTGLWATQRVPESAAEMSEFESIVRQNSSLSGLYIHIGWKELEKQSGKFDFSSLDRALEVFRHSNRKYVLGVNAGAGTPPFVFQEGAQAIETRVNNPHRATFGQSVAIPVPWDAKYQEHFSRLIQELGRRYADDPLCVGVVLTCANFMSAEMHLPNTPEARAKWSSMGDYRGKLLEVYKKYTDEWARAFPKQQLCLHISQVLDLKESFVENVIDYGISKYPERFAIQSDQLNGRREDVGMMTYDIILKYGGRVHHGFQSVGAFLRGGERMGSTEMAALNAVHAKAEYWELWHGDAGDAHISAAVAAAWEEAKKLGYEEYKKKLIAEGRYQEQSGRPGRGKHGGRNAGIF